MSEQDEQFDVVDEHNQVTGQASRYHVHQHNLLHRAVHIVVSNSQGEVFLQKRAMRKDLLPGCWTTSCSGHVDAGETYAQAAVREVQEELGIVVTGIEAMELLFEQAACPDTGYEFIEVYGLVWDDPVTPNPAEISEGRWLAPADVDAWIVHAPADFAPSFRLVWQRARQLKWV